MEKPKSSLGSLEKEQLVQVGREGEREEEVGEGAPVASPRRVGPAARESLDDGAHATTTTTTPIADLLRVYFERFLFFLNKQK